MSGELAVEAELNGIVKEFLEFYQYDSVYELFNKECARKGKSVVDVDKSNKLSHKSKEELLSFLTNGQAKDFFRRWKEIVPQNQIEQSLSAQKLELELHIHFAIFHFRNQHLHESELSSQENMKIFKEYIENKGRVICQTKEFLPYFGLPYHQDPKQGFPELFKDEWLIDLQNKLDEFCRKNSHFKLQPRLLELYKGQSSDKNLTEKIAELEQQLSESQLDVRNLIRYSERMRTDYSNLLRIVVDIIESLENTLSGRGQPMTSEYIKHICANVISNRLGARKTEVDVSRPSTAGEYVRKSLAYHKIEMSNSEKRLAEIDYAKIKSDLGNNSNEKRQIALLQALRWRLTKSETVLVRQKILAGYIRGDLLSFKNESQLIANLLNSTNNVVREFIARLINTFASMNSGRSYLASNGELIKYMMNTLRKEKEDSFTRKNLLAALQKLSVRHKLQAQMINEGVTEYIVNLLEGHENSSDYTLEYAAVFFMNLTFKSAGLKQCLLDYQRILKIIANLYETTNIEVIKYINGALYNLLGISEIKKYAKSINMMNMLKSNADDDTEIQQQRQAILKRLLSETDEEIEPPSNNEEEDDDDEEDAELLEAELDSGEVVVKSSQPIGEQLLAQYSVAGSDQSQNAQAVDKQKLSLKDTESYVFRSITPRASQAFSKQSFNSKPAQRQQFVKQTYNHEAKSKDRDGQGQTSLNKPPSVVFSLDDQMRATQDLKETNILLVESTKHDDDQDVVSKSQTRKSSIQSRPSRSHQIGQDAANASTNSSILQSPKYSMAEPTASTSNFNRQNSSNDLNSSQYVKNKK